MKHTLAGLILPSVALGIFAFAVPSIAQQPDGPQAEAPPAVAPEPRHAAPPRASTGETIVIPAGTRVAVVLENGISTGNAKPGDSVYFRTSFPITQNNHVIIPVGSYLRGELTETKRPGRIKGRGEFRMHLNTLILPNGYTVDLTAVPHSTDSGGKEKTDSEGKITGPGGKGADVGTIAQTTIAGAGIGAIAGGGRGAGIGAGIGGVAGLAATLLTRGPDAQLPRGSALDLVLERELVLDADQIHYTHVDQRIPTMLQPVSQQ
jgi:hypothetical protein